MTTNGSGGVRVERDIVYGKGGGVELKLDVYRPAGGSEKRTAVIQLHGGGFVRGDKNGPGENAQLYAERGYVAVASAYRLAPATKWPGQLEDVKAAVRWVRANAASLGVDADKIAVAGYSAGAHLALCAAGSADRPQLEGTGGNAGVSSAVAACIAYYPPSRTGRRADGSESPLLRPDASDADYASASPLTYMTKECAPTILFHGTEDERLDVDNSLRLFEALRAAGVPVEMHLIEGMPHVFDRYPEFGGISVDFCDRFLDRHVVNPRRYEPVLTPAGAVAPH